MAFESVKTYPFALGALLALTACGASAPASKGPHTAAPAAPVTQVDSGQPPRNQCHAQAAQSLVGQAYEGAATLEKARAAASADVARMLRPDSLITKEYMMGRVNVVVDAVNRVSRVYCG
ncbi:MAG: I78 family peptidase inhibitor [Comamonadaceae bacterium]|nr:I78 family peptidase inhibitor [Comamonadaceae bacterium]